MSACAYLPAQQEKARAERAIGGVRGVVLATINCGTVVFAGDQLCAEVIMRDGAKVHFSRVGLNSFGATATNVFVDQAGALVARMASCSGVGSPNFHRESALGHHFHPTLIDLRDAVARHQQLVRELEWWPQCPQYWEVQDKLGQNFRYCSRRQGATDEPPRPENCSQSSDSAK